MTTIYGTGVQITILFGASAAVTHSRVLNVLTHEPGVTVGPLDPSDINYPLGPVVALVGESADHSQLAALKAVKCPLGIVVLSDRPTRLLGTMLLAAGVSYVPDALAAADLLAAIRLTAEGACLFHPLAGDVIVRREVDRLSALTTRETEVFVSLRTKKKAAEIALTLNVTVPTVRTHLASIRRKLGVKTNRELEDFDTWPPE